jgi:hypothetical protein
LELIDIAHAFSAEDARAITTDLDKGGVLSFIGRNNIDNLMTVTGVSKMASQFECWHQTRQWAAGALAQVFPAIPEEEPTQGDGYRAGCPRCHWDEIV